MAPNVDSEPADLQADAPRFEKLTAPSADAWQFERDPVQYPLLMGWFFAGLYAGYVCVTSAKLLTLLFSLFLVIPSMIGLGAGVHRLWSHRAYKVKPQLEILLTILFVLNNQHSIITWAKRHRLHHQCSDTDGDPHNATRGFLFSHYFWAMYKPHPEVLKRRDFIDVSDLMNNPIVKFQEDYFIPLVLIIGYAIPMYITTLWGESVFVAVMSCVFRMNLSLQLMCCVNSVTHLIGYKPIDRTVVGTQMRLIGLLTSGEGFHNYHHAFPYDYRSSEFGDIKFNVSGLFIEFMAKIGWAYDLKVTSEEVVKNRVLKKGDGTDMFYIPKNEKKQKFFYGKFYKGFNGKN